MLIAAITEAALPSKAVMPVPAHIRRIILTGFMGAGKSTVGRRLAAELGWKFLDVDAALEETYNCTIASLFEQHGEEGFRRFESSAIVRALGSDHVVVALGGGAPEILTNRLLLEQTPGSFVVFLDAPFGELFDRCMLQPDAAIRPVLANPEAAAKRFEQRLPFYKRVARLTLETSGRTPEQTVEQLLSEMRALHAIKP
ncbi:MAG: shikimate kinase [Acidobacteria bacterium]|nr:shikimate kinase [Acidobacteriota bacterium]